ncbi:MAG: fused MFS/spermidine synthase [Verrucomicrobiia bacterium]
MNQFTRRVLFFLFFLSGFCSLAYQVVWTRMAFASFGIITPVLSVVLSVFMLGLAVGSLAGGCWISGWVRRTGLSAIIFYAVAELLIGVGAFVVPRLFSFGEHILLATGQTDSFRYLSLSGLVLTAAILPWCVCMGTTFPLMMAYIREQVPGNTQSFSFLYLANVLGAMSGTLLTALVWVEILGFRHTLWLAAAGNFTIAIIGVALGWRWHPEFVPPEKAGGRAPDTGLPRLPLRSGWRIKVILFATGFIAMAMEVVWTRAFTPVLKTQVYSFALIVFTYLGATFFGSLRYRQALRRRCPSSIGELVSALAITAFLPVLANDPRLVTAHFWTGSMDAVSALIVLASLCPFCALLGYLTPGLIDEYGAGQPKNAGQAYAINVLGCILGPLFACYVLLPRYSERQDLILLSLPFLALGFILYRPRFQWQRWGMGLATGAVLVWAVFFSEDFEGMLLKSTEHAVIRRDYTASVISFEFGSERYLLVNGIGMTRLTPITKFMAHLPLAFHQGRPESALIICFGMGTTYRSALSWNLQTTAVELVPSVTEAFGFYHPDAARFVNDPNGRIVIDDGRRYLNRTIGKFDVIVVDPPPPVEAAGSSLLFSREFCALARQHLNPGGLLQLWYPGGNDNTTLQAVVRAVQESFPYLRCFPSMEGGGLHLLASPEPIAMQTAEALAANMPINAQNDLLEWSHSANLPGYLNLVVSHEIPVQKLLNPNPKIQLTDDHPFNEYYLLRQLGLGWR